MKLIRKLRPYLYIFSKELFSASLLVYLVLLILETIKSGFVTFFFNINIILILVLISGIIMVVTESKNRPELNAEAVAERVWRYFFRTIRHKSENEEIWKRVLTEVRTKILLKKNYRFDFSDWNLVSRHLDFQKWAQINLPTFYRFKYLGISEKDWHYFKKQLKTRLKVMDIQFIVLLSFAGGLLVFYKTQTLGIIAFFISSITIIIIFLLSLLIFTEEE